MKAVIKASEFVRNVNTKYGERYSHKVVYNDKTAYYLSTKKDQTNFVAGKEAEFTESENVNNGVTYTNVKPILDQKTGGGYSKNLVKEQARYSGFAVSYVKDLIVSGHIPVEKWKPASKEIFDFMVELDKSIK